MALSRNIFSFQQNRFVQMLVPVMFRNMMQAYFDSLLDTSEFLSKYSMVLSKINFSHSFSPEHLEYLMNSTNFQRLSFRSYEILDFLHKELDLQSVRIGIRWNKVFQGDFIDLSYYSDLIRYCIANNVRVHLNIGPIKVFRWPEIHVPDELVRKVGNSFKIFEIPNKGLIFEKSKLYLTSLFEAFYKTFGDRFFDIVESVQNDNEVFNPYGRLRWIPSIDFEKDMITLTSQYFPSSRIFISMSGGPQFYTLFRPEFEKIVRLLEDIQRIKPDAKFTLGLNYYYKIDGYPEFANMCIDNFSFSKLVYGHNIFKKILQLKGKFDLDIEVSELQFEPWGSKTSPGSSLHEFLYALLRVSQDLDISQWNDICNIRLWGTELFALRLLTSPSQEILDIKNLIIHINTMSATSSRSKSEKSLYSD
ncbi:MAG: hypothetical protein KatS3mg084_0174 [Candidatus Dojkabacteria bacterium]|nr:MAG: hypothetical protein KatS3mg084_0174 [Candidatus Dojkabacteria bacterium]